MNHVLSGHLLSDESVKELSAPLNNVSASILELFKRFMSMPLANVFRNVKWRESVFNGIMEESLRFQEAKIRFTFEQFNTPILEFLQEMADKSEPHVGERHIRIHVDPGKLTFLEKLAEIPIWSRSRMA